MADEHNPGIATRGLSPLPGREAGMKGDGCLQQSPHQCPTCQAQEISRSSSLCSERVLHFRSDTIPAVHISRIPIMRTTLDDSDDFSTDTIDQRISIIDPSAPIRSKIP